MRILLWYWGKRGGGAQYALCLARALARRSDVRLEMSLSRSLHLLDQFRAIGVPMDAVPTFSTAPGAVAGLARLPALRSRLLEQARRSGADVVFSAMSHVWTPLVAPVLPAGGVKLVSAVHDAKPHPGDPRLLWDWRLRAELRAARAALAFSEAVATELARISPGLPVLRAPLGAHFSSPAPRNNAPPVPGEFVFFGRLRAYKGLDLLRDAFELLRARHPEATLRVVGEGDADACAPGLAALPGVRVEARWVPEAEMPELLGRSWAVVLPYREASQSGVLPLALSLGVPVVATPVGGLVEQLRFGEAGVLAESVTAPALADAMARLLNPAAREAASEQAFREGEWLGDWDSQAASLLAGLGSLGIGRDRTA